MTNLLPSRWMPQFAVLTLAFPSHLLQPAGLLDAGAGLAVCRGTGGGAAGAV
jgi:hypothetical protein